MEVWYATNYDCCLDMFDDDKLLRCIISSSIKNQPLDLICVRNMIKASLVCIMVAAVSTAVPWVRDTTRPCKRSGLRIAWPFWLTQMREACSVFVAYNLRWAVCRATQRRASLAHDCVHGLSRFGEHFHCFCLRKTGKALGLGSIGACVKQDPSLP